MLSLVTELDYDSVCLAEGVPPGKEICRRCRVDVVVVVGQSAHLAMLCRGIIDVLVCSSAAYVVVGGVHGV